jgi:hypothetical protein
MPISRFRPTDAPPDFITRDQIGTLIHDAWIKVDPNYDDRRKDLKRQHKALDDKLRGMRSAANPMMRSTHLSMEVKWLLNYRAAWDRVTERLANLAASLDTPNPPRQQLADGSWGDISLEPYRKLEPTVDALQEEDLPPVETLKPLKFMSDYQTPKWLLNELWRLQISDIEKTHENHRDQLGATQTALAQLIFKDQLRDILKAPSLAFAVREELEETFLDFLEQTQHPRTGYWGPWYRFGPKLYMVQDLSFTFHVVNYRSGNVQRWKQIVDTTLAMKSRVFPVGWRPDGKPPHKDYNNHNNYDVVLILYQGWPHMTADQKETAQKEIALMLEWCLTQSLQGDAFATEEADGKPTVDDFYFGVRFLDRIGFWDRAKRFWTHRIAIASPTPEEVCERLKRGFETVDDTSEMAETVNFILRTATCIAQVSQAKG